MATARKTPLRTVKADETAAPRKPKTLTEAIEAGDYLEILLAQRREIVRDLPGEKGPAKAAMHRQLALLSKDIEALQARAKQEAVEDAPTPHEAWDAEAL